MKVKKRKVLLILKALIGLWALSLVLFFINPTKNTERIQFWLYGLSPIQPTLLTHPQLPCFPEISHAWQLNDAVKDYWSYSFKNGIGQPIRFQTELNRLELEGKLIKLKSTEQFRLDTMYYSVPYVVPQVKTFIDTLSARFNAKLRNTDLFHTQLVVTSLLRTKSSVKRLKRFNRNAISASSHLHGTSFDISYATFYGKNQQQPFQVAQAAHLKEVLAQTLFELRSEGKCWVTYELFQTCFHVVCKR